MYSPERADVIRDLAAEAEDVSLNADSILCTAHGRPGILDEVLSEDEASDLEEILTKLSIGARRYARDLTDSLTRSARREARCE